jgi:hypothetical protein
MAEQEQQEKPKELENKVIIMNGFTYEEINKIINSVKKLFDNPKDLIFAKTTETSVEMKLKDLIVDMSEDHEYLKQNPPELRKQQGAQSRQDGGQSDASDTQGGGGSAR